MSLDMRGTRQTGRTGRFVARLLLNSEGKVFRWKKTKGRAKVKYILPSLI